MSAMTHLIAVRWRGGIDGPLMEITGESCRNSYRQAEHLEPGCRTIPVGRQLICIHTEALLPLMFGKVSISRFDWQNKYLA